MSVHWLVETAAAPQAHPLSNMPTSLRRAVYSLFMIRRLSSPTEGRIHYRNSRTSVAILKRREWLKEYHWRICSSDCLCTARVSTTSTQRGWQIFRWRWDKPWPGSVRLYIICTLHPADFYFSGMQKGSKAAYSRRLRIFWKFDGSIPVFRK